MAPEDVVLGVGPAGQAQPLRVGGQHMVGLHEALHAHLPIAAQFLVHVQGDIAVAEVPGAEVLRQHLQVVRQRFRLGVQIDENEALPNIARHFGKAETVLLDMGEVPTAGDFPQGSVQMPGHAVERAAQELLAAAAAAGVAELHAPVRAGVDERLQLPRLVPHDHHGVGADVIDMVVAGVGNMLLPAGPLPGAAPHALHLPVKERLGGVAGKGNVLVAEEGVGVLEQQRINAVRLPLHHLLGAGAGATGFAGG